MIAAGALSDLVGQRSLRIFGVLGGSPWLDLGGPGLARERGM